MPPFERSDDNKIPIGYTKITCHMIFEVRQDLAGLH
jgi:hypothetical protein